MTKPAEASLVASLSRVVGAKHVLTSDRQTLRFRMGYRSGGGPVLAVVLPGNLIELWRVAQICLSADVAMIVQAANTGLTGGSTPMATGYDRPVAILSTRRIKGVQLIDGGRQAICLAGATLFELEAALAGSGRQPHSVIGSSCIGASVVGGVCNNSGGALIQRGPSYTEWALFGQVDVNGQLVLVNHLGIALGDDPEEILKRLEAGSYGPDDITYDAGGRASDTGYAEHVRKIEEPTPARFNANPRQLHEAAGSAGHLIVFAVRLDTFPDDAENSTFYIGTNDPAVMTRLRRDMLADFETLPVTAEYIHRTAFDIAAVYGKDVFIAIEKLGTQRLPLLFAARGTIDALAARIGFGTFHLSDRLLQSLSRLFPQHLPARMRNFRDRFEHHLILKMTGPGIEEARAYFADHFNSDQTDMFECTEVEARKAFLHRFAVAGAAIRYRAIHSQEIAEIVALDVALPRNTHDWMERLPPELDAKIIHKLYYGHFFCQVFHQDYLIARKCDPNLFEKEVLRVLDARGAEYPAEHNVGHLYHAKSVLAEFYRALDPTNSLNPGIGLTSSRRHWR